MSDKHPPATVRWVDRTDSTFSMISADSPHGFCVAAHTQTSGRGQRGNSWEAAPGVNLTFSMCLRPRTITPARQYELSMLVSTAVCDYLRQFVPEPDQLLLKWPNDIYYQDLKMGGILIEQTLSGHKIERSVAGIGINVNQTEFVSNAPNPVSLKQLTGLSYDLEEMMQQLADAIVERFDAYEASPDQMTLLVDYRTRLWRAAGFHPYRERTSGRRFMGAITAIDPSGPVTITEPDGHAHTFAFKEVEALLGE